MVSTDCQRWVPGGSAPSTERPTAAETDGIGTRFARTHEDGTGVGIEEDKLGTECSDRVEKVVPTLGGGVGKLHGPELLAFKIKPLNKIGLHHHEMVLPRSNAGWMAVLHHG